VKKLLIIETIDNLAGVSEGKAIEQGLRLMLDYMDQRIARHLKIEPCQEAYTKSKLKKLLKKDVDYLHISSHGCVKRKLNGRKLEKGNRHVLEIGRKEKRGKIIKEGIFVTPDEISSAQVKARNVFVSACFSGHEDLAKAFFKDRRNGVYLGPCRKVSFDTALLVALNFHRGLFLDQSIRKGMNYVLKDRSLGQSGTYYYFMSTRDL
jgi:hypothetical protein